MCGHPERHSIDEALVSGAPYRSVAKRFELSESAVYRHKVEHLPAHLLKARDVEEVAQADDLLDQGREPAGSCPRYLRTCGEGRGSEDRIGRDLPGAWEPGAAWQASR